MKYVKVRLNKYRQVKLSMEDLKREVEIMTEQPLNITSIIFEEMILIRQPRGTGKRIYELQKIRKNTNKR